MPPYDKKLTTRLKGVGAALRASRVEAGISQEELAHLAGVHRTYVGAVERGERNVSLGSLFSLADALGIQASELLTRLDLSA